MSLSPCTESLQGHALDTLMSLPDPEAATALAGRLSDWEEAIHAVETMAFVERGLIVVAMERRMLWRFLDDPSTGEPFVSFSAWMGGRQIGCRSVNYEAWRDMQELADIPSAKLLGVPKAAIKILKQLSGSVRQQDAVLADARTLSPDAFMAKLEMERPEQHIEAKGPMRFTPTASQRVVIEQAIQKAIEDGAHDRTEALEFVCVDYCIGEAGDGQVS